MNHFYRRPSSSARKGASFSRLPRFVTGRRRNRQSTGCARHLSHGDILRLHNPLCPSRFACEADSRKSLGRLKLHMLHPCRRIVTTSRLGGHCLALERTRQIADKARRTRVGGVAQGPGVWRGREECQWQGQGASTGCTLEGCTEAPDA